MGFITSEIAVYLIVAALISLDTVLFVGVVKNVIEIIKEHKESEGDVHDK